MESERISTKGSYRTWKYKEIRRYNIWIEWKNTATQVSKVSPANNNNNISHNIDEAERELLATDEIIKEKSNIITLDSSQSRCKCIYITS